MSDPTHALVMEKSSLVEDSAPVRYASLNASPVSIPHAGYIKYLKSPIIAHKIRKILKIVN